MMSALSSLLHLSSAPPPPAAAPRPRGRGQRICQQCGTANTAQWRYAHNGSFLMCNACGIRWRRKNNNNSRSSPSSSSLVNRIHKPTYHHQSQSLVLPPLREVNYYSPNTGSYNNIYNTNNTTNNNSVRSNVKKTNHINTKSPHLTLPPIKFDAPRASSPISIRSLCNDVPISPALPPTTHNLPFMLH